MVESIMGSGKETKFMAKAALSGLMAKNIEAYFKILRNMEQVFLNFLTVVSTSGDGKTVCNMVKVCTFLKKVNGM
jgi:hypothetical protein